MELPRIGLGTWDLRGPQCTKIVRLALELGYQHIDTASMYENHQAIHEAIKDFNRTKIYLTSKISIKEQVDPLAPKLSVQKACEQTLKELGTDFLDLYLIHAPDRTFPLENIFKALERLVHEGKIRKAGVSNYTIHHLEDLREAGCTPFVNQIEFHPYLYQKQLLDYCHLHHIEVVAFRPFGKGKLLAEEPLFDRIGAKYQKSGAQIILRWLLQKNIVVIPKASSEKHLKENLEIFDFSLTDEELFTLDHLNCNKRYCRAESLEHLY